MNGFIFIRIYAILIVHRIWRFSSMVRGIGVDLCLISRIQRVIDRDGLESPFIRKCFTEAERKEAASRSDKAAFYAARFAAKEAIFKALSASGVEHCDLRMIETLHSPEGRPFFHPTPGLDRILFEAKIHTIHLSITTEGDFAEAFAIAEES